MLINKAIGILFAKEDDDDDAPGGGGGAAGSRAEAGLTAFKAKYNGDLERAVATLFDENWDLRNKNRKLKEQVTSAKLPDGARVLTAEEVADYDAYAKMGKPDQLTQKEEVEKLQGELDQVSRERVALKAAGILGYEPVVLTDLVKDKGLHVEVKDETVDGKPAQTVYVRSATDDKAALEKMDKYVTEKLPAYLPALKPTKGVTFPAQGAAEGSNGASSAVDKFLEQRNQVASSRPNPLTPQKATTT